MNLEAVWHDLECGAYGEDLALWRDLAARTGGPVLDVGAGTGRVTIELAAVGVDVVGLDVDEQLLEALAVRATGLPVKTVVADARESRPGRTVLADPRADADTPAARRSLGSGRVPAMCL